MNLHLPQYTATAEEVQKAPNTLRLLKRWQSELPLVNMGETIRLLYQQLRVLNRQQLTPKIRFEMLEQLRPSCLLVLQHLYKHLGGVSYPLLGKSLQISKLNHALLLELAVGYKHIVNDIAAKNGKLDKKSIVAAIHRAMRYLENSLAANAMTYRDNPSSSWHDVHRLQSFAEQNQFEAMTVRDDSYRTIDGSSITDVFKQICLLSMSQPLRLRSGESARLQQYFETAAHLVEFKRVLTPDSHGRVHVVSLKSSEPPAYVPLADITTFSNLRGFDLTRLISTLSDMADTAGDDGAQTGFSKVELDPQLIQRLITTWTIEEKRRFSRVTTNRPTIAAVGLKQVIQAISEDLHPELSSEELFSPEPQSESLGVSGNNAFSHIDPHSFEARSDLSELDPTYHNDILLSDEALMLNREASQQQPETWQNWIVSNTGAGGYGLKWTHDAPSQARVGELMALREKEYDIHHWRIGAIRWLLNPQDGGLQLGLQLIAPRALVVSVDTVTNRNHSEILPLEALMLPGMKAINQPPSLLVPTHFFKLGDRLEISLLDKKIHIQLEKIGEKPSFYTQFFYISSELEEVAVQSKEEFEDLWGKL